MPTQTPFDREMPPVGGSTEVLFIVADPVAQVKAPQAFNLVFAHAGVDAVVVPMRVSGGRLGPFVHEALAVPNVRGLFVSIPHKTPLMTLLDRFDATATAAGAVNAVRRSADGALEGALFDGIGFVGALRHHGVTLSGRRALLVGAGGAGLAIASALGACGLAELAVNDAQPERAAALAERIGPHAGCPVQTAASSDPKGYDLVVQATPLGLKPDDPLPLDPARLERGATVVDILMTQWPTPLERACEALGIAAFSGHEMMLQQMPAYLEYFGYPALARELEAGDPAVMRAVRAAALRGRTAA